MYRLIFCTEVKLSLSKKYCLKVSKLNLLVSTIHNRCSSGIPAPGYCFALSLALSFNSVDYFCHQFFFFFSLLVPIWAFDNLKIHPIAFLFHTFFSKYEEEKKVFIQLTTLFLQFFLLEDSSLFSSFSLSSLCRELRCPT